jgi:YD repeat-containing protein
MYNGRKIEAISPEVASLAARIENPVSLYTGRLSVVIPLFECTSNKIGLQLQLTYSSSGIKQQEYSSTSGLGWNLEGNGFITRVVKGLPDELYAAGFPTPVSDYSHCLSQSLFSTWIDLKTPGVYYLPFRGIQTFDDAPTLLYPAIQDYMRGDGTMGDTLIASDLILADIRGEGYNYFFDAEPDVFYFSIPGYSGRFILDPRDGECVLIPYQNITIIPGIGKSATDGVWKIITPEGNTYSFEEEENSEVIQYTNPKTDTMFTQHVSTYPEFTSSWMLTKIVDINKLDTILLEYIADTVQYNTYSYGNAKTVFEVDNELLSCLAYAYEASFFDYEPDDFGERISVVTYLSRNTIKQKLLRKIKARNSEIQINYLGNRLDLANGLKISSIEEYDNSSNKTREYKFYQSYFGSTSFDWGFLKNPYRLKLDSLQLFDNSLDSLPPFRFEYINPNNLLGQSSFSNFFTDHCGYTGTYTNMYWNQLWELDWDDIDEIKAPNFTSCSNGLLNEITYPTGAQVIYEYELNDYFDTISFTNKNACGVRIKKITTLLNDSIANIKQYSYRRDTNLSISSGTIFKEPSYFEFFEGLRMSSLEFRPFGFNTTFFTFNENCYWNPYDVEYVLHKYSNEGTYSLADFSGNSICYSQVIEEEPGNGYSVNYFSSFDDFPDISSEPYFYPSNCSPSSQDYYSERNIGTYQGWKRGLLLERRDFNNNDELVSKIENEYNFNWTPVKQVGAVSIDRLPWFTGYAIRIYRFNYISSCAPKTSTSTSHYFDTVSVSRLEQFEYDAKGRLTKLVQNLSDGNSQIKEVLYPDNFIGKHAGFDSLVFRNFTNPIGWVQYSKDSLSQEVKYIDSEIVLYSNGSSGIFPSTLRKLYIDMPHIECDACQTRLDQLMSCAICSNPDLAICIDDFLDNQWSEVEESYSFDQSGNIVELVKRDSIPIAFVWGYNGEHLVSKVENSNVDKMGYESFEEVAGWSPEWMYLLGTRSDTYSKTGHYSMFDAQILISTYVSSIVSLWSKKITSNEPSIEGYSPTVVRSDSCGWTYYEWQVAPDDIVLTAEDCYIDEVRQYPVDAIMTTYTYDPIIGMTSQTDANGKTTYYEYDSFGRLKYVKDHENNIVKEYVYHIKNSL